MADFKVTNYRTFSKPQARVTDDVRYWKKLGVPVIFKEFGPIDFIDFSPVEPYCFAVTCSVRIQLFNPVLKQATRNFSRFGKAAHGASFRSDGLLLCAGDDDCNVKLFDVNTKSLLRVFKGHTGSIHRNFFTSDNTHIASFSDDKSVMIWDIPSEKATLTYMEHNDYIRAGATSPVSPDMVLSGSYDQTVKLFDSRVGRAILSVDHGAPVESVLFLPGGGIFISAGGNHVKIWDSLAGGRLLGKLSHHHKTVTCLRLASNGKRLLSASLDRHVKIYDISSYQVVHTLDYPSSVLSLGVSANDDTVAVGFTDGLISMARRESQLKPTNRERKKKSFKYIPEDFKPAAVDVFVEEENRKVFSRHDNFFRKFEYSKALDSVMARIILNKKPAVVASVLQELIRRKGLQAALAGRDGKSLIKFIKFIMKNIGDYRFSRVLLDASNILLDVYGYTITQSPEVTLMLQNLSSCIKEEEEMTYNILNLQGALEMLLAGASVGISGQDDSLPSVSTNSWMASGGASQNMFPQQRTSPLAATV